MEPKVRAMLENMYDVFNQKIQDKRKAWDYLIEFLAVDNRGSVIFEIGHKFEWLFDDRSLVSKVLQVYDGDMLKSDYYDHLGDMYLHHIVPKSEELDKARYIRHQPPADELAELISPISNEIIRFFDPVAGTGRLLMAAHKKVPLARCFGIEKDLDMYRIAVTNFAIYDVPGFILNGHSSSQKFNSSSPHDGYNWRYANHWNPPTNQVERVQRISNK